MVSLYVAIVIGRLRGVNKFVEKWRGILFVSRRFLSNFVVRLDLSASRLLRLRIGCALGLRYSGACATDERQPQKHSSSKKAK